jgi:hypothetical protein
LDRLRGQFDLRHVVVRLGVRAGIGRYTTSTGAVEMHLNKQIQRAARIQFPLAKLYILILSLAGACIIRSFS